MGFMNSVCVFSTSSSSLAQFIFRWNFKGKWKSFWVQTKIKRSLIRNNIEVVGWNVRQDIATNFSPKILSTRYHEHFEHCAQQNGSAVLYISGLGCEIHLNKKRAISKAVKMIASVADSVNCEAKLYRIHTERREYSVANQSLGNNINSLKYSQHLNTQIRTHARSFPFQFHRFRAE